MFAEQLEKIKDECLQQKFAKYIKNNVSYRTLFLEFILEEMSKHIPNIKSLVEIYNDNFIVIDMKEFTIAIYECIERNGIFIYSTDIFCLLRQLRDDMNEPICELFVKTLV